MVKTILKQTNIPSIKLNNMIPKNNLSFWEKIAFATKRRFFSLEEDWVIELENVDFMKELNGKIRIPSHKKNGEKFSFDGASVPFPWLVSLLTIGILRPMGIMLLASIIHDYAYKTGHLIKENPDGTSSLIEVKRHNVDKLFKAIISQANSLPLVGFIAWYFVRIGWLFVKFNNKPRGGKAPYAVYLSLIMVCALLIYIYSKTTFAILIPVFLIIYFTVYIVSLTILSSNNS